MKIEEKGKYDPLEVHFGKIEELREIEHDREAQAELTDVIKWTGLAKTIPSLVDCKAEWEHVLDYFEEYGVEGDDMHLWRAYRSLIQQRNATIYNDILQITDIIARDYFYSFIRSPQLKRARVRYTVETVPLTFLGRSEDYFYTYTVTTERPIAIISVPTSGTQSAWSWLALPHEVGHNVTANVIGLLKELIGKADKRLRRHRYHMEGKLPLGVSNTKMMKYIWNAWMDEVSADFIGILFAGPSYVLSRLHDAVPEAYGVEEVDQLHLSVSDMQLQPHPNCYIRIHFLCKMLEVIGFTEEAETILRGWKARHRNINLIHVLDPERHHEHLFSIPVDVMLKSFAEVTEVLCGSRLASLGKNRLMDIISFTDLDWEVTKYIARQLCGTDDLDIPELARPGQILSASRLAFEHEPDLSDSIHENTIRAILMRQDRAGLPLEPGRE